MNWTNWNWGLGFCSNPCLCIMQGHQHQASSLRLLGKPNPNQEPRPQALNRNGASDAPPSRPTAWSHGLRCRFSDATRPVVVQKIGHNPSFSPTISRNSRRISWVFPRIHSVLSSLDVELYFSVDKHMVLQRTMACQTSDASHGAVNLNPGVLPRWTHPVTAGMSLDSTRALLGSDSRPVSFTGLHFFPVFGPAWSWPHKKKKKILLLGLPAATRVEFFLGLPAAAPHKTLAQIWA